MDTKFTDKYIKDNSIITELESKDFKSIEFDNGVYKTIINLKLRNEDDETTTLASARFFIVNGELADIVDAADSESGDLYFVADAMINYFKISQDSSIAILDEYNLFSSKATISSRKLLFEKSILPYFKARKVDYIGFCNAGFKFTNNTTQQQLLDKLFDNMTFVNSRKISLNDWKSTVNLIDINYIKKLVSNLCLEEASENSLNKVNDAKLKIDPFIEEYKIKTGKELPKDFKEQYDKYILGDGQCLDGNVKEDIINVYTFKKHIYYSEDGKKITITNKDREEMTVFQSISRTFEKIENLYDRVSSSYKNLIDEFISQNSATNPNMTVGAFLADGNMFIDYLDQKWLTDYIPEFKDSWKEICTHIYDNNLGYKLCYNLRNFDQHPQNHAASQIISKIVENINDNRVEYYLNSSEIYNDKQLKNKMRENLAYLQKYENDEFSRYARNYMINISLLYNLALGQFFTKNAEKIKNVYRYLYQHNFSKVMIKSIDDQDKKIVGIDYADDVISTLDIDTFLHCFESKGIINKQNLLDIRNGHSDTQALYLTPTQILNNVVKKYFPQIK